jgi:hypothetical protein
MSIVNLTIKFENITTPGYGEDMKLKPGIKGCATLELRHCAAGNVSMKRVRGSLFRKSYLASFAVLNKTVYNTGAD